MKETKDVIVTRGGQELLKKMQSLTPANNAYFKEERKEFLILLDMKKTQHPRNSEMNRRDSKETHSEWPQHFQHENHEAKLSVDSNEHTWNSKVAENENDLVDSLTSASQR